MKVFKFGGASVRNAEAVRNVGRILSRYDENLVVVVSAMGKTTNLLETLVMEYFKKSEKKDEVFQDFQDYHNEIIDNLFEGNGIPGSIVLLYNELRAKLKKAPSLDYDFEYDQIIYFGELVSTQIISDYLNYTGIKNQWVDIRSCLRTDDNFRDASVNWEWTEGLVRDTFLFDAHKLYVTQGFIASTTTNLTTSLGREGSDFTAAILGNILDAESVSFWKDVPGILSADPKKMDCGVIINELSYREALEMTHSGAKIIHPKTMRPLHNKGIPMYVKSFLSPGDQGTVIHKIGHKIELPPIFILKEDLILITLSPKDFSFISIEDIERVVTFLLENRVKVTLMQQSAIDLNLVLEATEADLPEIFMELKPFYTVRYNTGLTLITIRHYTEEVLDQIVKEKNIYLEQHSRLTARMLVRQ